ncbi:MAG: hydroxyacid dehydrogenase [Parcubacteria group bacterium]|nr:hydroxyacid dehydrogenase [Parcubacteria group bacterium]
MHILNTIGEVYTEDAKKILSKFGEVDYVTPTQSELLRLVSEYDVVIIGLGLTFDSEVLAGAKKLRVIATATTGLDHIDLEMARERGIEVLSLRGEDEFLNTITGTAELAWGLLISLLRMTPHAFEEVKNYQWDRENFRGRNLYGKTLGIVGMGRLGTWMGRYGKAFGMRVLYADPNVTVCSVDGCERVSFDELLKESDVISVHAHLSPETENMFNADVFAKMKQGAYLVNTSRGAIVDEAALVQALERGSMAGYATDVLTDEKSFETEGFNEHPLVEFAKNNKNCIIVPHIGGMTVESRERTDVFIAEKLKNFVETL